jgi:hypothetical protein
MRSKSANPQSLDGRNMWADLMDDLEISLAVQEECNKRRAAQTDPNADPSLYAPWGIMSYPPGYERKKCYPPRTD